MVMLNTPYGTLAFPQFFQPKERAEGGDAVYSGAILFDKEQQKHPFFKALRDACVTVARTKFGPQVNMKEIHMPFRDAGEKAGRYNGYNEGDVFINPWTKNKPDIVDANRQPVLLPEQVWAGQLVRFNVSPFAWINSGKKGVSFALNHVQIIKDGPRIDGRVSAGAAFDDGEVAGADMFH
jgi:hypothetical protein